MSGGANLRIRPAITAILLAMSCTAFGGRIIYVDIDANGLNDGSSWENAYTFLQDALADANSADKPVEIRVAPGTYRPDQGAGQTHGDREATFQLINGVALKGGYAGLGQADPDAGDLEAYETILSGDLAGNDIDANDLVDLWDEPSRSENSLHVLTGSGTDSTAVMDGVTIAHGHALCTSGGGMYNYLGCPTLSNCSFNENSSRSATGGELQHGGRGGAIENQSSSPTLINCNFNGNCANVYGSAINNQDSSPLLTNCMFVGNKCSSGGAINNWKNSNPILVECTFISNSSSHQGGGIRSFGSNPTLTDCKFIGNSAVYGGAMFTAFGTLNMSNCSFEENFARSSGEKKDYITYSGGGMSICSFCVATLTNCTFIGNQSLASSGGISIYDNADITLRNCMFIGNTAQYSGGAISSGNSNKVRLVGCTSMANSALNGNTLTCSSSHDDLFPSEVEMINCIIRDAGDKIWNDDDSLITITYSNVQGSWPGEGNIDADPLFADPANNDYHLKSQAGRWDPASQSWVKDDVTSPCVDTGGLNTPIGHEPFPNGGIINMGAYGGTAEASKSHFGEAPCGVIIAGDINGDCKVDFKDFVIMVYHWLEERY